MRVKIGSPLLLLCAFIVAGGGIIYELIVGTAASYILGNSILQFSLTIGLFLFGMGIGSLTASWLKDKLLPTFITTEILLALIGSNAVTLLFFVASTEINFYIPFITLTIILGILIGINLPIIFQLLRPQKTPLVTLSRLLSIDYLGSLAASMIFPLLLLPYLGLIRTAYLIGIIDCLIAAAIWWHFHQQLSKSKIPLALGLVFTLLVTISGFIFATQIAWQLDHKLYQDEIIYSEQSQYQKIILTKFNDDLRLYLDGNIQFSSIDEHRYHEALVHPAISKLPSRQHVLILGGGDGLAAREILRYPDVQTITIIDIDPAITRLSSTHQLIRSLNEDSLTNSKVKVINQDAILYLNQSSQLYQAIIADLPDPNNESLSKLYAQEFYQLIEKRLSADGVFVTQATSPYFSPKAFSTIVETIQSTDMQVYPYHTNVPSFGEWGFVMASKYPLDLTKFDLSVETYYLTSGIVPSLFIFDKDIDPIPTSDINTYFQPVILKAYEEDARRWQP